MKKIGKKNATATLTAAARETKPATHANNAREIKPAVAAKPVTTIEAKIDVGFGNRLFLRGEGAGLSWEHGTPLTCVDGKTWRWQAEAGDKLKFKLLLNDAVWAAGEDLVATPGTRVEVTPAF
jgi:hypothetical protein